ncbi:nicotinate phosphoribosyltransferase [Geminicoccaceae bacterium 1502E]|nr:nicotinate phosphoribosyltransferase [Geminicoccaceae bacterium 1502E]
MTYQRAQGGEPGSSLLLTDLYELNMFQAYFEAGMEGEAVFEFFVRKLPPERNFAMAAGLEQAVTFLEAARFGEDEIAWLEAGGRFSASCLEALAALRFTGSVEALPEGTLVFPDEPILRLTAPLPQAQLFESRLINILHFQTMIASKAARMVLAAEGHTLVDFGLRRAHGAEAGLLAARAAYLAGFDGSATVLAEARFGVPAFGTMAHSFIQAHGSEEEAFLGFARARPRQVTLLIDTYDTEEGARKVVRLAPRLAAEGAPVQAVRLDSGDLAAHARAVRGILDEGGLAAVRIFASGSLDENEVARLLRAGAPIDGFGVGTSLTTSGDRPSLDCAYKLMEYDGIARRKRSEGKATWPGRKQVWRRFEKGRMAGDTVTLEDDPCDGEALLVPVMREGRRLAAPPALAESRVHARSQLAALPAPLRTLEAATAYPVAIAPALRRLAEAVDRRLAAG